MADASITIYLDETLYVGRDVTTQISFDLDVAIDEFTYTVHLVFGEVSYACANIDAYCITNLLTCCTPYSEDVGKPDQNSLITRQVNT